MTGVYTTEKRCTATHEPSNSTLETDAPRDNHGRGQKFSPTDLLGVSLGTCILTTLAILHEGDGIDFKNSTFSVTKEMISNPRRVASLNITLELPRAVPNNLRSKLETTANNCPVKKSLHPDISANITIHYSI